MNGSTRKEFKILFKDRSYLYLKSQYYARRSNKEPESYLIKQSGGSPEHLVRAWSYRGEAKHRQSYLPLWNSIKGTELSVLTWMGYQDVDS